jgi:uncharacterized damage-inducible protein DinB
MSRKEEIISGLEAARQKILDAVAELSPEKLDEVFLGTWSVKDLLAHLVGWDYTNMDAVRDIREGKPPRAFEHWDPDWVQYNAELVSRHKRENMEEMLRSIEQSHNALVKFVRTLPAEDIVKDFGVRSPDGRNITVEWFLQFEIDDEGRHYQQIRDWLG